MTAAPVACFGEMLLRLASPVGELMLQTPRLQTCFGGAEANVAVSLARLGQPAAMITTLPDNPIGAEARAALQGHGVDTSRVRFAPGRMGLYFLTPGAVTRPSEVIYDRARSAFAEADLAGLDWADLLGGVAWLHVSGVTAATGPNGAAGALAAMRAATAAAVPISFDGNFRGKMWEAWGGDAPSILRELFSHAQLAFADDRDMALVLGAEFDAPDPAQRRRDAARAAFAAFPRLQSMACTIRTPLSVERQDISAMMFSRDKAEASSRARGLERIVERIGGGDAFAAGLLFGKLKGRTEQGALDFALAASCLKHSIAGDFNLATAAEVDRAMTGDLDVRR